MKTLSTRSRRHRNPPVQEVQAEQQPFFSLRPAAVPGLQTKPEAFFQPKLIIGQANDPYEQQADAVANQVVSNESTTGIQKEEQVQRAPQKEEEEMKPAVQMQSLPEKEKEEKVQMQAFPKEEEDKVQMQALPEEEDEEVQAKELPGKEEEEKVQTKVLPEKEEEKVQMQGIPEKEEEEQVQTKADGGAGNNTTTLSSRLASNKGQGQKLPDSTRARMEEGIGADFSQVTIHTDSEAIQMNQQLQAQAFTHGSDIYFNQGKYDTSSSAGKLLLAHELTHVIQQGQAQPLVQRQPAVAPANQQLPGISTPVPAGFQPQPRGQVITTINGVQVIIRPDTTSRRAGQGAVTNFRSSGGSITQIRRVRGRVTSFQGPGQFTVTIQTTYQRQANPQAVSGYGRGTTAQDQATGDTSLRFHEGSHGTNFLQYLQANPLPGFNGTVGMTMREFNRELRSYRQAIRDYFRDMAHQSLQNTDCVGTTIDQATGSHVCVP